MKCKDCGRKISKLYKGERICGRCAIGYDQLYGEEDPKDGTILEVGFDNITPIVFGTTEILKREGQYEQGEPSYEEGEDVLVEPGTYKVIQYTQTGEAVYTQEVRTINSSVKATVVEVTPVGLVNVQLEEEK